jgi:hypothetical protein
MTEQKGRSQERRALAGTVRSRHAGSKGYPTEILDLSPGGCRVELSYKPKVGEMLWITLPGIEAIESKICWTDGFMAGVAFTKALYPSVFDLIAQRIEQGR